MKNIFGLLGRTFLLAGAFLCFCQAAYAQTTIGLKIFGPQFSDFNKKIGVFNDPSNEEFYNRSLTGLLFGLTVKSNIHKAGYLYTELLYSMRGESYRYKTSKLDGYDIVDLTNGDDGSIEYYLDYRLNYIEIPVMYSIDITHKAGQNAPIHVFISSGFSTAFNVVSQVKHNYFRIKSPGSTFSGIEEDYKGEKLSETNKVLINFVADLEAEFRRQKKTKMFLYGRFNHSLTEVFKKDSENMKTRMATCGFGFGLRWNVHS